MEREGKGHKQPIKRRGPNPPLPSNLSLSLSPSFLSCRAEGSGGDQRQRRIGGGLISLFPIPSSTRLISISFSLSARAGASVGVLAKQAGGSSSAAASRRELTGKWTVRRVLQAATTRNPFYSLSLRVYNSSDKVFDRAVKRSYMVRVSVRHRFQ